MDPFIFVALFVGLAFGLGVMKLAASRGAISKQKYDQLFIDKELLAGKVAELNTNNAKLNERAEQAYTELRQSRDHLVRLQTELRVSEERLQQHQADLANMEQKSRDSFQNLATKIFEAQAEKFNSTSKEKMDGLLAPLQEQLKAFEQKVNEHVKEQFSLKNEIEKIVNTNQNLTNALKNNSKTQGDWGELVLENILEASGLRRDEDYIVQAIDLKLRNEEGKAARPDVIVKLPEKKHIIIDSKVSLTHFESYCSAIEETAKAEHLRAYLASVRKHVCDLQERGYQHIGKLGAPDFVLMFLPTEGAYALAIQQDGNLHRYAWDRKIILVCPATLFATLRTVASIWRLELQNQNAVEIARQGGALYDKVCGFMEDMQFMGKQLDSASSAYSKAMNKLTAGRDNILSRAEKMKMLGATTKKDLPVGFISNDEAVEVEAPVVSIARKNVG